MKKISSKYFYKYLIYCLLLSILPTLIIIILNYNQLSNIMQKKIGEGNIYGLNHVRLRVEQAIKIIEKSSMQFVMLPQVEIALQQNITPDNFRLIDELRAAIRQLGSSELAVEEAYLINPMNDWVLSEKELVKYSTWEKKSSLEKYFNVPQSGGLWSVEKNLAKGDSQQGNTNSIIKVFRIPLSSTGEIGLLYIKVPCEKLTEYALNGTGENIIVVDSNGIIIIGKDQSMLGNDIHNYKYFEKIKEDSLQGNITVKDSNGKANVSYIKTSENRWVYINKVSVSEVTAEVWSTLVKVFVTSLLILFTAIIFAFKTTQRMYLPLHKLSEYAHYINGDPNDIESNDEFSVISESLKNLAVIKKEVTEQLENQTDQLREYNITKLLQGKIKYNVIDGIVQELGYDYNWDKFCLIGIQVISIESSSFEEKDIELIYFSIDNILNELISDRERFRSVVVNDTLISIIGNKNDTDDFIHSIILQSSVLKNIIYESINVEVLIGISRAYEDFNDMSSAYDEVMKIFSYNILDTKGKVVYYENLSGNEDFFTKLPFQTKESLLHSIKLADVDSARSLLGKFIIETFSNKLQQSYIICECSLFFDVLAVIKDDDLNFYESMSSDVQLNKLLNIKRPQELEEFLWENLISPVISNIKEGRKKQSQSISSEIIKIIQSNYDKDISLVVCSQYLNYNTNYISKVFKEETGITFSEYLANYRLEIAKKLLRETDMKISDIANKLQYTNTENFIRYFKKLVGFTPGQYRKMT